MTYVYVLLRRILGAKPVGTLPGQYFYIPAHSYLEKTIYSRNRTFRGVSFPLDHSAFDEHIDLDMISIVIR